jgi:hypothetical protein
MTVRQYICATGINILVFSLGFGLARLLAVPVVEAQTHPAAQIVPIQPGVTTGTFGASLILAHEIQADSLVVNGYDLLRFNQNIVNYLARHMAGASLADLQQVVNDSAASHLYTLQAPAKPSPPPTQK